MKIDLNNEIKINILDENSTIPVNKNINLTIRMCYDICIVKAFDIKNKEEDNLVKSITTIFIDLNIVDLDSKQLSYIVDTIYSASFSEFSNYKGLIKSYLVSVFNGDINTITVKEAKLVKREKDNEHSGIKDNFITIERGSNE